jgi:hypothetical protein
METNEIRKYFEIWRKKKSKKFKASVERMAEEIATDMFMEMVRELDAAKKRLSN